MRRIVITGPAPVQVLDVTGPLEVFASAPGYEIVLGSSDGSNLLQTSRGFALTGALPLDQISGPIDTLLIAGGPGAESGTYDPAYLAWIAEAATRSRRVAGICTGAFTLAAAGLLDGKHVVTHWDFCDRFAREFPAVLVDPGPIYLRDGSIYTSAGITAGIDLTLALVEEDHGHTVALDVARRLVMFLVRPGGQAQYSHMLSSQAVTSQPLRELQVWMLENLREDLGVEQLAERIGMSPRHFTRVCLRETRMNPGQLVARLRVEAAQQQIDSSSLGLKQIADACGFQTADSMRRTFLRVLGVTPGEYASRFKRSPPT
jgi:transcriptional regulator GlxA family with amidase domain